MTSVLESVLAGPPSDRWLTAHHDPLAGIYTFSACMALSGIPLPLLFALNLMNLSKL
jgi:hypothetical protein